MRALLAAVFLLTTFSVNATTLRWAAQNDILTFDPHSQNHTTTITLVMHVYESLTRYGKKSDIDPSLATGGKEISPTQWRFNLRKNVKFHAGTPFTADDVIFSYGRIKQPQGTMQIYVDGVKEIRKIDEHTVDFILAGPDPVLLRKLTAFRIMSKVWAEKNRSQNDHYAKAKDETNAPLNANAPGAYIQ